MIKLFIHFRIECDPDGWTLRVNNEASLDTLYHFEEFPLDEIVSVEIFGGGTVSYTGFGDKGSKPTPKNPNKNIYFCRHDPSTSCRIQRYLSLQ